MKTLGYVGVAGALGAMITVACSGGVGGGIPTLGTGYDQPPIGGYQAPAIPGDPTTSSSGTTTTDDGGDTTDDGGDTTVDASTTTSSGSTGTSGTTTAGCPKCDQTLTCAGTDGSVMIVLTTTNGACTSPGDKGTVTLDCSGNLLQNGSNIGTWQRNGTSWTLAGTACTGN